MNYLPFSPPASIGWALALFGFQMHRNKRSSTAHALRDESTLWHGLADGSPSTAGLRGHAYGIRSERWPGGSSYLSISIAGCGVCAVFAGVVVGLPTPRPVSLIFLCALASIVPAIIMIASAVRFSKQSVTIQLLVDANGECPLAVWNGYGRVFVADQTRTLLRPDTCRARRTWVDSPGPVNLRWKVEDANRVTPYLVWGDVARALTLNPVDVVQPAEGDAGWADVFRRTPYAREHAEVATPE